MAPLGQFSIASSTHSAVESGAKTMALSPASLRAKTSGHSSTAFATYALFLVDHDGHIHSLLSFGGSKTDLLQVITQIRPLILSKHAHGETDERPQVYHRKMALEIFRQIMYL